MDFHYFLSLDIWSFLFQSDHSGRDAMVLVLQSMQRQNTFVCTFLTTYYSLLANANLSLELRTPQSNCPALPVLSMGGVEDLRERPGPWFGDPEGGVVRQSVPATGCETEERAADVASSCC